MRHEQRPGDLEQRGPLDALDVSPEVTVVAAKVAEPPASGPGLECHRQRLAVRGFIQPAHLREQGGKRRVERRADVNLLLDVEGEVFKWWCCEHRSSPFVRCEG